MSHILIRMYMLSVSERLSCIRASPDWKRRICQSPNSVREWWTDMEGNPQMNDPDIAARGESFKDKCIPLGIHGDGVPVVRVGKAGKTLCDVWHWNSIIGTRISCNLYLYTYAYNIYMFINIYMRCTCTRPRVCHLMHRPSRGDTRYTHAA